jgi:enoyl-CoA hydratase/carnithine racemase
VTDTVLVDIDGPIGRITLSNPDRRNALTWRMYDELQAACSTLHASNARVAVIRGAGGKAFAAGTDINQFRDLAGADDGVHYEQRTAEVLTSLLDLRVPLIAAVEGPAVGAGLAIALCSDVVVSTPDAQFGAPIARTLGNCLQPAVTARLYASIGRSRALRLLMTAELLDADRAEQWGLVSAVVDRSDLATYVDSLTQRITAEAPLSLAAFKTIDARLCAAAESIDATDIYRTVYGSRDFREGVDAFLHKRLPAFEGH